MGFYYRVLDFVLSGRLCFLSSYPSLYPAELPSCTRTYVARARPPVLGELLSPEASGGHEKPAGSWALALTSLDDLGQVPGIG